MLLKLTFANHFKAVIPELFLTFAIFTLLMYGVIYTTLTKKNNYILIKTINWLAIQTLIITIILFINNPINQLIIFNDLLIIDELSTIVKIITCLTTICCILLANEYIKLEKLNAFEYSILFLLALLGMILIISAYNLLAMYLAIELQSLSLYILAAFKRKTKFSTEAGLKYFILGALSSGLLLFGCSLIYGFSGVISFNDLSLLFGYFLINETFISSGVILGVIFILIALLFKLAVAPFHMWAPDVYEGAPTSVTAFFAIVPKIAILTLLIRLFSISLYGLISYWQEILFFTAICSILLAAFAALEQKKIKRFLAYSAIGHIGYILIGLIAGTPEGVQASLIYIIIYIVMSINVFAIILSLRSKTNLLKIKYLSQLHNLGYVHPLLAITFVILLFSMAGIPPLAGFYGKLLLFVSAIDASMYLLAIIGVIASVIGSVYYIRLIKIMYFEKMKSYLFLLDISLERSFLIGISSLFILTFFLYPTPFILLIHKSVLSLCL